MARQYAIITATIGLGEKLTLTVVGEGNVTYSKTAISGNTDCISTDSPCAEEFSFPSSTTTSQITLTATNKDGTNATTAAWSGTGATNCTGKSATCVVTLDPNNTNVPAITATLTSSCSIGAPGPAGGIIFYISSTSPCQGLEVAQWSDSDSNLIPWGCWNGNNDIYITVGGTSAAIGTGAANTAAIIAACGSNSAAGTAAAYSLNGYTDWYLPSIGELDQLYRSISVVGLGFSSMAYWSSTEIDINNVRMKNLTSIEVIIAMGWDYDWFISSGEYDVFRFGILSNVKGGSLPVRAVRAF